LSSRRYLKEFVCEKGGPNRTSIDPSEKMFLDYQLTVLLVKVVRTTLFEK